MIKRIECIVSAERMGYNYLLWVGKTAKHFKLVGKAFVRDDGSIEIIAEGDDEKLAKFIRRVKCTGPLS